MAGLFRFDAYPRDWFLDTRDLSQAAKGIYIDLLMAMYGRGGALPNDEQELCRLCGCATARSLRPLLAELISQGKIKLVDEHLTNGRAMREIEKFNRRQAIASEGGKARSRGVQLELSSNSARTQPVTQTGIEENQQGNMCSRARAPSPSPKEGSVSSVSTSETAVPAPSRASLREEVSGAQEAPRPGPTPAPDPWKEAYDLGKRLLGPGGGGQVTKLRQHFKGDLARVLDRLQLAKANPDPGGYIAKILQGDAGTRADDVLAETDRLYRALGVS